MDRKNLIQRATDYFGVAYYGFLALYAIYEFIFRAEYVSIVVIAPLFCALAIFGGLLLISSLLCFYRLPLGKIRRNERLEEARSYLVGSIISIFVAVALAREFSSLEMPLKLYGGYSLILVFVTVIEILLRALFLYTPQTEEKIGFSKLLDRVRSAYPSGAIVFLGLYFGVTLVNSLSEPPGNLFTEEAVIAIALYLLIFLFCIDWLNKKALRWCVKQRPYQESSLSSKLRFWSARHPSQPRLWSFWTTFLLVAILTLLAYFYLGQLFSHITSRRLNILLFAGIYAILAWYRWKEIKQLGKQRSEVQA